jgi:hypothetical protein
MASFIRKKLKNEKNQLLKILEKFNSVYPPNIFVNVHENFISATKDLLEGIIEFCNALKLGSQEHMDKGGFLAEWAGSKYTKSIDEFINIINNP